MALPGYAAETSLYMPSRSYLMIRSVSAADAYPTLIAQHDPCAMPRRCPPGYKCCGEMVGRWCSGRCVANYRSC
jgi:hypothetical protein